MSRVLILVAHPDDEILGVGGTIKKLTLEGHTVDCLILGEGLTSRENNRVDTEKQQLDHLKEDTLKAARIIGFNNVYFSNLPDNRFDSIDFLDVVKEVDKFIQELKPEIIYTHHYGDLNIDHRVTFNAVITACRPIGDYFTKEIYCFETPSSTEWNFQYGDNLFKPNVFMDIESTVEYKLNAMAEYKSEIREYPHPRSLEALEIIAKRWGTVVGKKYVEAFELIRKVE